MRSIHITSPKQGSIGEVTLDLIQGLSPYFLISREGESEPLEKDILLSHFINPAIIKDIEFNSFKKKVLIQPIDGTKIKKDVVELFNKYDLIITPASAGKKIMIANGVTTEIKIIPNFFKEEHIVEELIDPIEQIPQDKFVFYHESTFHPRKGIEFLYEGFVRAFSDTPFADKVVLVCKDSPFNQLTLNKNEELKKKIIKLQKQYKVPADIIKISQKLDWDQLKRLWSHVDVYVSFAKMEGFGIPILRMAANNKPILTLNAECNGYMDFLDPAQNVLVPTQMEIAHDEHMQLYTEETQWAVPTMEDVILGFTKVLELSLKTNESQNKKKVKDYEYSKVIKKYKEVLETL